MKTAEEIKSIESKVWNLLKYVIDPEVEVNIVDLGLVYKVIYNGENLINITMTLSTPACPIGDAIVLNVKEAVVGKLPDYQTEVDLVFDPPWTPDMVSEEGKKLLG